MTNVRAPAEVIPLQKEKVDAPTANRRAPRARTMMQTPPGSSGQGSSSRSRAPRSTKGFLRSVPRSARAGALSRSARTLARHGEPEKTLTVVQRYLLALKGKTTPPSAQSTTECGSPKRHAFPLPNPALLSRSLTDWDWLRF